MENLHQSTRYKSFIQDRNREIEQIALNAQTDVSRLLFEVLDRITGFISHTAIQGISIQNLHYLTKQLDTYTWQQFYYLLPLIVGRIRRMRKATFVLAYISELEGIARATKKTLPSNRHQFKMKIQSQQDRDTLLGQKLDARVWVLLSQLQSNILTAFRRSIAMELGPKEVVDAVKKAYPRVKGYRLPPRTLKPLRESDAGDTEKKEFDFYADLTNDEDWELAVDAYKDTELPSSRFDTSAAYDEETGYRRYNWELEQEINDDFVRQVRDGQVEAANNLGIKDGVWTSIIDNKTCDVCCLPRNGRTSSEIESMLKSGELDADECDAIVPPGHPFCRCDWVPVASTDEVEGPDWASFGEWLNS